MQVEVPHSLPASQKTLEKLQKREALEICYLTLEWVAHDYDLGRLVAHAELSYEMKCPFLPFPGLFIRWEKDKNQNKVEDVYFDPDTGNVTCYCGKLFYGGGGGGDLIRDFDEMMERYVKRGWKIKSIRKW